MARLLAQAGDAYTQSALVLIENQKAEQQNEQVENQKSEQQKKQEPEGGSQPAPQPGEACSSSRHRSRHRSGHRSRRRTRSRTAKRDRRGSRHRCVPRRRSCNVRRLSSTRTPPREQEVIPPKARPHRHSYKRPQTGPRSPDPRTEQEERPPAPPPPPARPDQRPEQPERPEQRPEQPADPAKSWDDAWWAHYREEMPDEDYYGLSKSQRQSRRRRVLKALVVQESAKPACESGGGVSGEAVSRD